MWNLKNKVSEKIKLKQTHRHREQTYGCQRGGSLEDWVKKVRGLRSRGRWSQNSHRMRVQPGEYGQQHCHNCVVPGGR